MAMPSSTAASIDPVHASTPTLLTPAVHAFTGHDLAQHSALPLADSRYRLLIRLQASLDLDEILMVFHTELSSLVAHCGMAYVHETQKIRIMIGMMELHSCSYRLVNQHEPLGEIVLYHSTGLSSRSLTTVETLLSSLICPLRNALQYRSALHAAMTDPLTGAGNRLAMSTSLAHEVNLARRYHHDLSILVIDIDKFKMINDTQGHTVGDNVLQELVRQISRINRNTDRCYRYGGEEFVVILSRTDESGAMVIAERLRAGIANIKICTESGPLHITVSLGASSYQSGDTEESLLKRADTAMYQIKNRGGNNVAFM